MALSTSTSTLAAGASRTFNLSPGSALTLVAPPNVRATVTETPNTVSASDVGGNASRTHNLQMVQTVTYGPYPMGGTVVVANASNSGATITWVRRDSIVAESAGGAVSLVSGDGTVPVSFVLGMQHTAQSKSDGDALESAALYTLDIPANTLGPNSVLRVRSLWTTPSSGATKRLRGRFGGTVLWNLDLTTHVSYPLEFILANRNSLASQIAQANNLSWAVALGSSAVQTFTVDFATAQQFTITAQWPVAGAGSNNITLESVMVEHLYGR